MKLLASVRGVAAILAVVCMDAGQIASGFGQVADEDLEKFQGEWSVIRLVESDGKLVPDKIRKTLRVTIRSRELLISGWDGEVIQEEVSFSLDPSRTPKAIDERDDLTKKVNQGIYLLADDRLTICMDMGNKGRPTEFSSKDGRSLFVLQRVNEPVKPGGNDLPEKPPVPKTSPEQEVRTMQGLWKIVAAEDEGQNAQDALKALKVVITGNKIVFHYSENDRTELIVTVQPDKRPKEMNVTLRADRKDKALLAIYSLEDGELRLCFNNVVGQPRPVTFSTKAVFTSRSLLVLKRVQNGR